MDIAKQYRNVYLPVELQLYFKCTFIICVVLRKSMDVICFFVNRQPFNYVLCIPLSSV